MASSGIRYNMTAIIYDKRGRILSIGKNSYIKTHPLQKKYATKVGMPDKVFLHAEIAAIIKCADLSRAYKIFISRFDYRGQQKLAKPCPICINAIKEAGIKEVYHT